MILPVIIALAAVATAAWAYGHYGSASHTLSDSIALFQSGTWMLAGFFLILGGFRILGAILILAFSFIFIGKADRLSDQNLRQRLAS